MSENILAIAEDKSFLSDKFSNLEFWGRCDNVSVLPFISIKGIDLAGFQIVIINSDDYSKNELFKLLDIVKRESLYTQVLFYASKMENDSLSEFYNRGMYDFFTDNSSGKEIEVKIKNCMKYIKLCYLSEISNIFVSTANFINSKSNLYTHKSLKEAFDSLIECDIFKNSVYIILTISDDTKTKVSMNRLANILKKNLRATDIIAQGLGKFYLLLPDTDLEDAKLVIEKVSQLLGSEHVIRSGICKVGSEGIEKIEKNATDGLKSAIINDELYVCLGKTIVLARIGLIQQIVTDILNCLDVHTKRN